MRPAPLRLAATILWMIPAALCLVSCTRHTTEWEGRIETVDGIPVVHNPIEPLHPGLRIVFEEDLSIGAEQGDESTMFGSRLFLNSDDDGNIYVSDVDINTVKTYDTGGTFLRSIGRSGQGPGEFQNLSEPKFDGEGNIYLNDIKSQRISFLSREGVYLRDVRPPGLFEDLVFSTKGQYIARSADNVQLGQGKRWDYFYGLFDEEFNQVAEFLRLPQEVQGKNGIDSIAQAFADDLGSRAFTPSACYVLDRDDLIYFGYPLDYEIKVYSLMDGKLVKIIQRDYEPIKIGVRHKEHFRRSQSEQFMAKMPPGLEDEIFDLVDYPKYKPAYERFTLMENGWLFVVVDSMRGAAKSVDIFNERGEYLARFETDVPTEKLFFKNGKAYSIAYVKDYPYIKRYGFQILGYDDDPC